MRMVNGSFWLHPRGPYVTMADLWDEDECVEAKMDQAGK